MSAVRTTNLVEGNLAAEPKVFPKGQYDARVAFRILHTDRRLNQETGQWEDERTSAVSVNFYGAAAERLMQLIDQQPGLFAKGTAVIAWGAIAEPDAYMDRDGYAAASLVLTGTRIVPNQLVNQRRAMPVDATASAQ